VRFSAQVLARVRCRRTSAVIASMPASIAVHALRLVVEHREGREQIGAARVVKASTMS